MTKNKRNKNTISESGVAINSRCLDFCHQEIAYTTQRLAAELSIAKKIAANYAMTNGGRANG